MSPKSPATARPITLAWGVPVANGLISALGGEVVLGGEQHRASRPVLTGERERGGDRGAGVATAAKDSGCVDATDLQDAPGCLALERDSALHTSVVRIDCAN